MEEKSNSIKYNDRSAQSQLDRVLEKLEDAPEEKEKRKIESRIYAQSHSDLNGQAKKEKTRRPLFKDLGWYLLRVKKWVILLTIANILVYVLQIFDALYQLMVNVAEPLLLIVDFIVFGMIAVKVKRKDKEGLWQAIVTPFIAGFFLGLAVSIFKVFWYRQFWTINNLIIEPMFMGLLAATIGLVVGLFVKRKKI